MEKNQSKKELLLSLSKSELSQIPILDKKEQVKELLRSKMEKGEKVLLVAKDRYFPQSAVVVTIDKLYDNFALCHSENRVGKTVSPYTINYYSLVGDTTQEYRPESQFEDGDKL